MRRYVLTGAPGAGKTSILRALGELGLPVVEEAATDVIARNQRRGVDEPWQEDGFVDQIVALQRERLAAGPAAGSATGASAEVQVHDRSVLCTLALARFLGRPLTPLLTAEAARVTRDRLYERQVFLVEPIGFVRPTAARRISYRDALEFGRLHEAVYREHGFELVSVAAAGVAERAAAIAALISPKGLGPPAAHKPSAS